MFSPSEHLISKPGPFNVLLCSELLAALLIANPNITPVQAGVTFMYTCLC